MIIKNKIFVSISLFIFFAFAGMFFVLDYMANADEFTTGGIVNNVAPSFTAGPSDSGSSAATPTNVGSNVTFTATATDQNGEQYYLIICKTNTVYPGDNTEPGCQIGQFWAVSGATNSDAEATAFHQAVIEDPESNAWYGFVCDKVVGGGLCSAWSQGTGDNGSPFEVNHRPVIGTVNIGATCGTTDAVPPGNSRSAKVTTAIGSGNDNALASAIQSDGKIVLAGNSHNGTDSDFALIRYNTDGTLDASFGAGGKVTTPIGSGNDYGISAAIQDDGKIVVAGMSYGGSSYDFALVRYTTAGALDTTFNSTGKVTTSFGSGDDAAYSVALQSDGKIVATGYYSISVSDHDFALARYNIDGSLDTSFDTDGKVTTPIGPSDNVAYASFIQSDGKIVAGGYSYTDPNNWDFALARYNTNGSLDTNFDTDGLVITSISGLDDFIYSVAIQSDGKIVAAGYSNNGSNHDFAVARYTTAGALDTTFNSTGKVTTAIGSANEDIQSIAIQSDGKIVAGGFSNNGTNEDFALIRYTTAGALDTTFNSTGKVTTTIGTGNERAYSVIIRGDGKIVAGGYTTISSTIDFALVRYNTDGSLNDLSGYVCTQAAVIDADVDGPDDTVDMYVCNTDDFTGGQCETGEEWCKIAGVRTGDSAQCVAENLVPSSATHGTGTVYMFLKDSHGFADVNAGTPGDDLNKNNYTIANTAPTHDTPELDVHAPTLPNSAGYWQFEDGSGATSFDDETANSNNGSCTNCPDWTQGGMSGGAYTYNGTNDYVDMGDQDSLDFGTSDFTLSAWIKTTSSASPMIIAGKYNAFPLYNISMDSGVFNARIAYDVDNSYFSSDGSAINNGAWHYVVAVFSRSGNMTRYVDGSVYGSAIDISGMQGMNIDNSNTFRVGATVGQYFAGSIDEVHVYNRALTATEITAYYNAYTTPGTSAYTTSSMDLSAKPVNIADHDSDTTTVIYNWKKNGSPIAVLNMPFDSNVTSTTADAVLDYSGNGNHGTLGGGTSGYAPTWTSTGVKGGAYDFDGTDDYAKINYDSSIDFTSSDFTTEAWIKTDSNSLDQGIIGTGNPYNFGGSGWALGYVAASTVLSFQINNGSGGNAYKFITVSDLSGSWHHVAASVDRNGNAIMYLDGLAIGTLDVSGESGGSLGSNPLNIGKLGIGALYFDGKIDEVRIFGHILSAAQIAQNYNNGKPLYNTIAHQQLSAADTSWVADVTINDAQTSNSDSTTKSTNAIDPSNSAPVQNFPSARAHALLDTNSVGYWQFEEGDGVTSFDDKTSYNNNGSCTNCPVWTEEGAIGGGLKFDGVDDYISGPSSSSLDVTTEFTICAWVKAPDQSSGTIFSTNLASWSDGIWFGYDKDLIYGYIDGVGDPSFGDNMLYDQWVHMTLVLGPSGSKFYRNGEEFGSDTRTGTITNNNGFVIGKSDLYPASGLIDEVHFYDRALTETEIKNLYNSSSIVYDSQDLGLGARDMSDADGDSTYATVDWRKNGTSFATLNMSFDKDVISTTTGAVKDYSTYGNNGTLGNGNASYAPTWTNATTCGNNSGGCYSFGGDDCIQTVFNPMSTPSAVSMEGWFNSTSTASNLMLLSVEGEYVIYLNGYETGKLLVGFDGSTVGDPAWGSGLNDGLWHHFVATNNGAITALYVDGGLVGSRSETLHSLETYNDKPISVGSNYDCTDSSFIGKMDEVRVYNRVLSSNEIALLYNAGKPNFQNLANQETAPGDKWKAQMTIAEGNSEESVTIESNEVEIAGFSTAPSDGGSSTTAPTNVGNDVTFTATASTTGSQWYLAMCKDNAVAPGDDAAPTCNQGWNTAGLLETDNTGSAIYPQITFDNSGNALAVWKQSDGSMYNIYANRYTAGVGWGTRELIETDDSGVAFSPQIASDPLGNMIAVWQQSDGTRSNIYANRYVAGSGWSGRVLIETVDEDPESPQVAMDSSGNALAVWQQYDGIRDNIWANRYTAGIGWGTAALIETDNTGDANDPQVAMDHLGNALAAWEQFDGIRNNIWANRYTAGVGWGTAALIETDNTGTANYPQIDFDNSGNALAVWQHHDGLRYNIFANRYTAGVGWGTSQIIDSENLGDALYPQIASDSLGNMVAVWYQSDGTRDNIWANRYIAGSGWGTAGLIETDNVGDAHDPQVASDPAGNMIAVWHQFNGSINDIWANHYSAGSWAISAATNDGAQASVSYTTSSANAESNPWYAFACTKVSGGGSCSPSSQSSGNTGSPFVVNHAPSIGTVKIGAVCNSTTGADPNNSRSAKITTAIGSAGDSASAMAMQSDGKAVLAGHTYVGAARDFALARYSADGTLDTSFDTDGKLTMDLGSSSDTVYAVNIQSNGKIVVTGFSTYDFTVVRLNSNGSADTSFDGEGRANVDFGPDAFEGSRAAAIQPDGKIVLAGSARNTIPYYDFALARLNTDGSLDTTFSGDGKVTTDFGADGTVQAVVIQSDGKIVAVGYSNYLFAVARYNSDGTPDTTFDTDGMVTTDVGSGSDYGTAVGIQSNGKIVAAGYSNNDFAVVRYNTDGSLDSSFDSDGIVMTDVTTGASDFAYGIAVDGNGKIVVAGSSYGDFALVRYNTNGSLDTTFDTDGKVITSIATGSDTARGVVLQSDGMIVAGGYSNNGSNDDFSLVRYNTDGSLNDLFGYVCVQAGVTDADTSSGNTVDLYFCDTNVFTGGVCASGQELCKITGAKSGDNAQCVAPTLVSAPAAHGAYTAYVFAKDSYGLLDADATHNHDYSVNDVPPTLGAYTNSDTPILVAGGVDAVTYSATLSDLNGDNDVILVDGVWFDDAAMNNDCTASDQNCYLTATCTRNDLSTPGAGKLATGTDTSLTASCSPNIWFNANASSQWKAHVNPTDHLGRVTSGEDSTVNVTIAALSGISAAQTEIPYGTLALGTTSAGQPITFENMGNQMIDVWISGSNMTSGFNSIGREQQKFHESTQDFDWGGAGAYPLTGSPGNGDEEDGCLNRNLDVRTAHLNTSGDQSIYMKIRIPDPQASGTYTGTVTIASTNNDGCSDL